MSKNVADLLVENLVNAGVKSVLEEAFAHDGPAVINVFTDPDALAMPPKVEFEQIKGFATSMGKLMLNGQTADAINTAKSNIKYLKELSELSESFKKRNSPLSL